MNDDESMFCSACGASLKAGNKKGEMSAATSSYDEDSSSFGFNLVGFFIPLVGLIMFCFMYNRTPRKATAVGKWALFGFLSNIVLFFTYCLVAFY